MHRRSLIPDGVLFRSERLDQGTEFLRSKDNWFRPVNFVNAPDGTLYVLDLAREVLEAVHIPMDVVAHLDLTRGRDRGRIYRVIPKGFERPAQPNLSVFTTGQLVASLEDPNAWWRETAHRLLYERQDKSAEGPLRRLLKTSRPPQARLHALWSLEGLKVLSNRDILTGLSDIHPAVRENALQLAEPRLNQSDELLRCCVDLAMDPNPRVRYQLAFTLGETIDPRAVKGLATLARRDAADYFIRTAIQVSALRTLSRLNGRGLEEGVLARWRTASPEARREILSLFLAKKGRIHALLAAIESDRISPGEVDAVSRSALLRNVEPSVRKRAVALWGEEKSGTRNEVIQTYRRALTLRGDAQAGQATFHRLCSSCHRLDGIGNELGPNLALAATRSPEELLVQILDPNREVNPAYIQYTVEVVDGETVSGLMIAEHPASVTLKGVNFEKTIPRQRIRKIASDGQSLMPVGLEQGLSLQEMADLLSFLIESQYDFGTSGHSESRDVPERR